MSDAAPLTDDEILAMRRLLAANTTPERDRELNRRARELEAAERRAAYEREIAESEARAARDPASIAARAKAAEDAKAAHAAEVAQLRFEAKLDIAADVDATRKVGIVSDPVRCRDCGLKPLSMKQVGFTNVSFCVRCHALSAAMSAVPAMTRASRPSWRPADGQFRCPQCLEEFASKPLPKPTFLVRAL
jgi:hypothetical protein